MTTLTKNDIKAFRTADDLVVHLGGRVGNDGEVRLIKRKSRFNPKPFETDQEYRLENCKVRLETAQGMKALHEGRATCFAMVGLYHSQRIPASNIIKTLKEADEITFSFWPDAHSNDYVRKAGLHADVLYLHVRRPDGKSYSWELDVSVCPDNSARMCKGVLAEEGEKV